MFFRLFASPFRLLLVVLLFGCLSLAGPNLATVQAQSKSKEAGSGQKGSDQKSGYSDGSGQAAGSGDRAMGSLPVGLKGYCPVALSEMKQWIQGDRQFHAAYDGRVYHFAMAKAQAMFQAAPGNYVPVLGGDDVVQYAHTGQRTPGQLNLGVKQGGRLFFFANEANKQAFQQNTAQYANADLALGGDCVVCQRDMQQRMPGNPQIVATHGGLRYLFVGSQQRDRFLAAPGQYAVQHSHGSGNHAHEGGSSRQQQPAGSGSGPKPKGSDKRGSGSR